MKSQSLKINPISALSILSVLSVLSGAFSPVSALANAEGTRCAERVREAGCSLSNNDVDRIDDNVQTCKHMNSGSNKTELELFLLKNSDKLVVVQTKGSNKIGSYCPVIKYTVDRSGVKAIKIIGNKSYMLSDDGQLYVMYADQSVHEILNASGNSYRGIKSIKGVDSGRAIEISGSTFKNVMTDDDLEAKKSRGQTRRLHFVVTSTERSLFRDE
jgi:hypothetical protein